MIRMSAKTKQLTDCVICYTNSMSKIVFPVGIPGSGKSTWARTMLTDYSIISSDDIRRELFDTLRAAHDVDPEEKKRRNAKVWEIFYGRVRARAENRECVYADGTNLRNFARNKLRTIANETSSQLHVIIFDNAFQAWERNTERAHDLRVPTEVMSDFAEQFEAAKEEILHRRETYDSVTIIGGLY